MSCTKSTMPQSISTNYPVANNMGSTLLEKHKDDSSWAEVIKLYSGLFETSQERDSFIIDLSGSDVLLAAQCKTSSSEKQDDLEQHISTQISDILDSTESLRDARSSAYFALAELERYDMISYYLENVQKGDIGKTRLLLSELPWNNTTKSIMLSAVSANPRIFLFNLIEKLKDDDQNPLLMTSEEINGIFELLVKHNVKTNHLYQYLEQFKLQIQGLPSYREYALVKLPTIQGVLNLLGWIRIFKLDIPVEPLIMLLIESCESNAIDNIYPLLEKLHYSAQSNFLSKLLNSSDILITIALIFLFKNKNHYQHFKSQVIECYDRRDTVANYHTVLVNYSVWRNAKEVIIERPVSVVEQKIKDNIFGGNSRGRHDIIIKKGDNINCTLLSKGTKRYVVQNKLNQLRDNFTYLIPFEEANSNTDLELFSGNDVCAVVLHVDFHKDLIYLSARQSERTIQKLVFKRKITYDFEVGEIIVGTIGKRLPTGIRVITKEFKKNKCYGWLECDSKKFTGITQIQAEISKIKGEKIILSLVRSLKDKSRKPISEEKLLTSYVDLRNDNSLGLLQKILLVFNERIIPGNQYLIGDINRLVAQLFERPIMKIFPTRAWLAKLFENEGILDRDAKRKNLYTVLKPIDNLVLEKINFALDEIGWNPIQSIDSTKDSTSTLGANKSVETPWLAVPQVNEVVPVTITDIKFMGLDVQLESSKHRGKIFISELGIPKNIKVENFQYEGVVVHLGQRLMAKIISFDPESGIHLSLKNIKGNLN